MEYARPFALTSSSRLETYIDFGNNLHSTANKIQFNKLQAIKAIEKDTANLRPGLKLIYAEEALATLDGHSPGNIKKETVSPTIAIPGFAREDNFYLQFTGYLYASQPGMYTLKLASDDGSRLWLHDSLAIENDGLHSALEKTARVYLMRGHHPVKIEYFEGSYGQALYFDVQNQQGHKLGLCH
ncbi:MAG: hypothetical protein HC896_13630 [Bacteroidales bacterium]|nr:hypothetical protein [Bacteroidales bacterium]